MADAIQNALRRKSEIEGAISQFEIELGEIRLFLSLHEKFSGTKAENADAQMEHVIPTALAAPDGVEPPPDRKRGRPADFAAIMARVLEDLGHPLSRPELVTELERRSLAIPSDDKPRYLGTILWRHRDVFRNLPGHGYWLKGRPWPDAGYDPANDTELQAALDSEVGFIEKPELSAEVRTQYARLKKRRDDLEFDKAVGDFDADKNSELLALREDVEQMVFAYPELDPAPLST